MFDKCKNCYPRNKTLKYKIESRATFSLKEIAESIYVRYIRADINGKTSEKLKIVDNHKWVTEQRHRKFGRCYTIYPDENVRQLGIYYIKIKL